MKVLKQPRPKYSCIIDSPIGKLGVIVKDNKLIKIGFLSPQISLKPPGNVELQQIVDKIKEYFFNPKVSLKFSQNLQGTLLQKRIWRRLQKIPFGETITYGELAKKVGTNPRVIGNACRLNPIPLVIPCHRVVAAKGLGGFCGKNSGRAIKIKQWLLDYESLSNK